MRVLLMWGIKWIYKCRVDSGTAGLCGKQGLLLWKPVGWLINLSYVESCRLIDLRARRQWEESSSSLAGCHHGSDWWHVHGTRPSPCRAHLPPCPWAPALCSNGAATVDLLLAVMSFMASEYSKVWLVSARNDILSPSSCPPLPPRELALFYSLVLLGPSHPRAAGGGQRADLARALLVLIQLEGTIMLPFRSR